MSTGDYDINFKYCTHLQLCHLEMLEVCRRKWSRHPLVLLLERMWSVERAGIRMDHLVQFQTSSHLLMRASVEMCIHAERQVKKMTKDSGSRKDINCAGWRSQNEVRVAANDKDGWLKCVEAICATWHKVDRKVKVKGASMQIHSPTPHQMKREQRLVQTETHGLSGMIHSKHDEGVKAARKEMGSMTLNECVFAAQLFFSVGLSLGFWYLT